MDYTLANTVMIAIILGIALSVTMTDGKETCWKEIDQKQSNMSRGKFDCQGTQFQGGRHRSRKLCCSKEFPCIGDNSKRVCNKRIGDPECLCEKGRAGVHCENKFKAKIICNLEDEAVSLPNCSSVYLSEFSHCKFINVRGLQFICESGRAIDNSQASHLEECRIGYNVRHEHGHNQNNIHVRHNRSTAQHVTIKQAFSSGIRQNGRFWCILIFIALAWIVLL